MASFNNGGISRELVPSDSNHPHICPFCSRILRLFRMYDVGGCGVEGGDEMAGDCVSTILGKTGGNSVRNGFVSSRNGGGNDAGGSFDSIVDNAEGASG
jgi:hypothetical protein